MGSSCAATSLRKRSGFEIIQLIRTMSLSDRSRSDRDSGRALQREKRYILRKHAISSDAYQKGEEQYRTEIEKYRAGMNARTEPKN